MCSPTDTLQQLTQGLGGSEHDRLSGMLAMHRRVPRGQLLYCLGDRLSYLYVVQFGTFKKVLRTESGYEQILSFHMSGDMLGVSALSDEAYTCDAVAIEDSEVICLSYAALESMSRSMPTLGINLARMVSRELLRFHSTELRRSGEKSCARVAAFLLELSRSYASRGYCANRLIMRMTREEIGAYLGVRLETVSRSMSELMRQGIIGLNRRDLVIFDLKKLACAAQEADMAEGPYHTPHRIDRSPNMVAPIN